MTPGQLELTLDYPQCLANATACERCFCPFNLPAKAPVRCSMRLATITGGLTVSEIAEVTGDDRGAIDETVRRALRKVGPKLALIWGLAYDPRARPCTICDHLFVPDVPGQQRICSEACRARGRRERNARWAQTRRSSRARRLG